MKRRHRPSPQTLAVLLALAAKPERWSHYRILPDGAEYARELRLEAAARGAGRGAAADPGIAGAAAGGAIAGVVL